MIYRHVEGIAPDRSPTVWAVVGHLVPLEARQALRRVVVTFTLPTDAGRLLSEVLGAGFALVDIKLSEGDEDIVLVSSSSRQLPGSCEQHFRMLCSLLSRWGTSREASLGGQVLRTLDAGADGYFVARSVDELASIVGEASGRLGSAAATEPAALTSGASDELGDVLDALLVERQNGGSAVGRESRSGSDGI